MIVAGCKMPYVISKAEEADESQTVSEQRHDDSLKALKSNQV